MPVRLGSGIGKMMMSYLRKVECPIDNLQAGEVQEGQLLVTQAERDRLVALKRTKKIDYSDDASTADRMLFIMDVCIANTARLRLNKPTAEVLRLLVEVKHV
jgi:hypothetical protein